MPRQCIDTATGSVHTPGVLSVPPTKRVAAVVSYYTSEQEVFVQLFDLTNASGVAQPAFQPGLKVIDQQIDWLLANGVTAGKINLKLTNFLEHHNADNAVPGLGCCLYDQGGGATACCDLTQEQCDALGGQFVAGGQCQ